MTAEHRVASIGLIGASWRAQYYLRIAAQLPERFAIRQVLTRSESSAQQVTYDWGVGATTDRDHFLRQAPFDYVVVATPRDVAPELIGWLVAAGVPVLAETPPAQSLAAMTELFAAVAGAPIQVAEQYRFQPQHAARLHVAAAGLLGRVTSARMSIAHGYHGVSMLRGALGIGFEPAAITAQSLTERVVSARGRDAWNDDFVEVDARRTTALLRFGDGGDGGDGGGQPFGQLDFADEQYFSPIRARHISIQASRGELTDDRVSYLAAPGGAVHETLHRETTGVDGDLEGSFLRRIWLGRDIHYQNQFAPARLNDDELAVAEVMHRMAEFVTTGNEFYGLADASHDHYLGLLVDEAAEKGRHHHEFDDAVVFAQKSDEFGMTGTAPELIEWGNSAVELRLVICDGQVRIVGLGPVGVDSADVPFHLALNPVELQCAGDELPQGSRHVGLGGSRALRYESHRVTTTPNSRVLSLVQRDDRLRVESRWEVFESVPVIRCSTVVTNHSNETVVLESVSSLAINGLMTFGSGAAAAARVAIAHNTFFGEFQWSTHSLAELGVIDVGFRPDGVHSSKKRIAISSVGTQPTAEYLPMGAVTDAARQITWAWQIEHNGSWSWEIGDHLTGVYLVAGGPQDQEHQWHRRLAPGDTFTSVPVAIAAISGGLDDVFAPLTSYRRLIRRPNADNVTLPIVFNDYMNCLVAEPSEERLLPVIAAAAGAGAEYFCVDAGWYSDRADWWNTVGEWTESSERFPRGFSVVFDAIRSHGMIPGLWIEPEVVGVESRIVDMLPDSAYFWRNGARVDSAGRHQLDLRSPEVVARLDGIVDRLVGDYGLGYLKFDYNINAGVGTDVDAASAGDGLLGHNRAYLSWIDRLFERYPGLVIEACASGGARADYATLSRHSIMSTSDQTDHVRSASIAAGAPTGVTPEQAAVWVYPQAEFPPEEFAFSLVNGMLARPQLSGRIWLLDDDQLALVAEAMGVYSSYREQIPAATPVWPLGLPAWTSSWIAQGLRTAEALYLAIWRRGGDESIRIPLPGMEWRGAVAEVLFPVGYPTEFRLDDRGGELALTLPTAPAARLFRISASPDPSTVRRGA